MSNNLNLPSPIPRNLFLAKQVDQDSINSISKAIIEINEDDEYLSKIYSAHDLIYNPKPIKLYIDSYGGYVYQCMGLLGIMKASKAPIHTIVTGCAMSCGFLISVSGHKRFGYAFFMVVATSSKAACNCSGNFFPRFSALRRIPAQAFALK